MNHWESITQTPKPQWLYVAPPLAVKMPKSPKPRKVRAVKPPKAPVPAPTNPWALTDAQRVALEAYVKTGSQTDAALLLGVTSKCIEGRFPSILKKMNQPNRVMAALAWDRWARAAA